MIHPLGGIELFLFLANIARVCVVDVVGGALGLFESIDLG